MGGNRWIVTICGSMRFFDRMLEVAVEETAKGKIVLMPYVKKSGEKTEAADLDELHRDKLSISDEALFVAPGGYMGESTKGEYAFAQALKLPITIVE